MDDYGVGASVRAGLEVYASAARGSGRTERLLLSLRGGEVVVCGSAAEERDVLRRWSARPGGSEKIRTIVPRRFHPMDVIGELPGGHRGAVVFTETAVEAGYREGLAEIERGYAHHGVTRLENAGERPERAAPAVRGSWRY